MYDRQSPPPREFRRQKASDLWRRLRCRGGNCYYPAAVCLLLIASSLRFYDLAASPLYKDEYVAVSVGIGSFPYFVGNLHLDSVPVIHPLLLWGLQEVTDSPFILRAIPATASVLAIAALLFLLPRLGISRWVAFLAAALMTISLPALIHARDAQEYSLDTLVAVLMTAGLLLYLRTRRKALLCLTLFLGPLVLYGLALYGSAVLATAAIARRCRDDVSGGGSGQAPIWGWLRRRLDWFWPAAALLAGSAATWLISLRYQWVPGGWGADDYLKAHYFDPDNDPLSAALPFAASRLWDLLSWQLPAVVAALAVIAFGIILLVSVRRRRFHPLLILALFSLGIALAGVLLSMYPLGGIRQASYWGTIIFLAAGLAFYGTASQLAAGLRREGIRLALLTGLTLVSLGAGAYAISESREYPGSREYRVDTAAFYAALAPRLGPADAVYINYGEDGRGAFYLRENPRHYRRWRCHRESAAGCREETVKATFQDLPEVQRIWFNVEAPRSREPALQQEVLRQWAAEGKVKCLDPLTNSPERVVCLARDTGWLREQWAALRQEHQAITAGAPLAQAGFDLYLREGALHYHRKPCAIWGYATRGRIIPEPYRYAGGQLFLKVTPLDLRELPPESRADGYQAVDFDFTRDGFVFADYCWSSIPLPEHDYPIAEISAGQYLHHGPPVWEHTIDRKADYFRSVAPAIAAEPPAARSVFDLYLKDDGLYYHKKSCAAADTAARFFLHFTPLTAQDLPPERRTYGTENRDFDFDRHGAVFDGKCMARISRPDYPIAAVRSGQLSAAGEPIWTVEFHSDLTAHYRETYAAVTAEPPAYSGVFDLYRADNRLHYVREQCSAGDTAARFLLHIIPADAADLPPERQEYGMDNRDFAFAGRGAYFDGKCMATVKLPDYPIAAIITGQFVSGEPPAWSVELAVGE